MLQNNTKLLESCHWFLYDSIDTNDNLILFQVVFFPSSAVILVSIHFWDYLIAVIYKFNAAEAPFVYHFDADFFDTSGYIQGHLVIENTSAEISGGASVGKFDFEEAEVTLAIHRR